MLRPLCTTSWPDEAERRKTLESILWSTSPPPQAAPEILLSGTIGLVAKTMSTVACDYASVSFRADTEQSDLAREHSELIARRDRQLHELGGDTRRLRHVWQR
ncbi:VIT1/CCC1 transporter family protein [Jannaschia helgolandensis]|uniref:VIT1/CCC1 transporter family protein n=1 Tax=Jannaschia helgolandensis TaxID=188906 RepID=UPI003C735D7E